MMKPLQMAAVAVAVTLLVLLTIQPSSADLRSPGSWHMLVENAGISAMHMTLTHNNKVVIFDGFSSGPSNISQPSGECKNTGFPSDQLDCTAHSVVYDIASNTVRPLTIYTDTWCSSAASVADGTLVQVGGHNNGSKVVRYLTSCQHCDWTESTQRLAVKRWFSTSHVLPDNRVVVVGGRGQFSYEFVPRQRDEGVHQLSFLAETNDMSQDNLYPFVHLTPDGKLFIFANSDSILLDYRANKVVRRYPRMPGLEARNYPSSGSSVMLPLDAADGYNNTEVVVCGGAAAFNYAQASRGNFINASQNCGRMKISEESPSWTMEAMPMPRVMGDMVMLPTGDVLIINGAQRGTAGWHNARVPALQPVLYKPNLKLYSRFQTLAAAVRPRVHHSSAVLLPDGSVLVGGSNPNSRYMFRSEAAEDLYMTDLSLEAFQPPYLDRDYSSRRPSVTYVSTTTPARGRPFTVRYRLRGHFIRGTVAVSLIAPPFASHGYSMGQRMIKLPVHNATQVEAPSSITGQVPTYEILSGMPETSSIIPSGYYMLFVVHAGLPSHATWIKLV